MNSLPVWSFDARREEIKAEIRSILAAVAKESRTISYTDLVTTMTSHRISRSDPRLVLLLEEISAEENAKGRGMLSVLVFDDEEHTRLSFFELAKLLGREITNLYDPKARERVLSSELTRVHAEHRDP